jgi:hypothetical protein
LEFLNLLQIFLFGQRLVFEVILLFVEIGTQATVAAADQVGREPAVATIFAEGKRCAVVRVIDRKTVVTQLTSVQERAIDGALTTLIELAVHAVFIVLG